MTRREHRIGKKAVAGVFLIILILGAFFLQYRAKEIRDDKVSLEAAGDIKIHFLDVGQADCTLIQAGGRNMLIDAGNNDDAAYIISYLQEQGVERIDYAIGTHGHEDHIGSMDDVIMNFQVGELFLPEQTYDIWSYTSMLATAENKGVKVTHPHFKDTLNLGEAQFMFVMPDPEEAFESLNDSSLGIRVSNGKHSFLLCGDAGADREQQILDSKIYLRSDVYKVSHHGSSDANAMQFLEAVDPEYAVISCGKDNEFGHPHKRTLSRLREVGAKLFRTDEQGVIVLESDGETLTCNVKSLD